MLNELHKLEKSILPNHRKPISTSVTYTHQDNVSQLQILIFTTDREDHVSVFGYDCFMIANVVHEMIDTT